jgi:hypothetical protein
MATGRNLSKLASGIDSQGVLSAEKGGTGNTTGLSTTTPSISSVVYPDNDTAVNTAGGQTVTINGSNFNAGIKVVVNDIVASVVTRVSATQITFTAPANPPGTYLVSITNTDGTTALVIPGLSYSGVPNWTTAAGSIGSTNPNTAVNYTVTATVPLPNDAPVTYSVVSGALPTGVTLNPTTGVISGTTPVVSSSTTYNFTIRATDAQNQDTDRAFSLTSVPNTYATTTLLVGGGGGGAMGGGGGGGGGVIEVTFTAEQYNTYNIVVGAGGQGSTNLYGETGVQGGSSSAFGFTAYGGGGGGLGNGGSGASGGGSSGAFAVQGSPGTNLYGTAQGYPGGQGYGHNGNWNNRASSGGGGGAGGPGGSGTQVGVAPQVAPGGNGGSGKSSSLSGASVIYSGGGPGNGDPFSTQLGNAGAGQGNAGGGGSGLYTGGSYADNGKNGLVIVTYPDIRPLASSTTGSPSITTSGGFRRYSWSSVGNWSITF